MDSPILIGKPGPPIAYRPNSIKTTDLYVIIQLLKSFTNLSIAESISNIIIKIN